MICQIICLLNIILLQNGSHFECKTSIYPAVHKKGFFFCLQHMWSFVFYSLFFKIFISTEMRETIIRWHEPSNYSIFSGCMNVLNPRGANLCSLKKNWGLFLHRKLVFHWYFEPDTGHMILATCYWLHCLVEV